MPEVRKLDFSGPLPSNIHPYFHSSPDVECVIVGHRCNSEVCREVAVTRQKPVQDSNRIAGTAVGAVVGGLLGNQVGGGNGKKIATVVGAVGGGYAGNQVQGRMQANDTYTTTETRCNTVTDSHDKVVGYDVKYQLNGAVSTVRMDRDPGSQIPLRDG